MEMSGQQLPQKKKININEPDIGEEERKAVLSVLQSKIFSSASIQGGPNVQEFERKITNYVGAKYAVAVNSGTSALYSALAAIGVGHGSEVLLPSFTFVATANVVVSLAAKPVFVDIDREDYTMSINDFERKASRKKANVVMPVHLYGYPAKMTEINKIASECNLVVIEDAAQSIGSTYKSKQTGALGSAGCFSFYAAKVIMSGEGGAVTTNDLKIYERLRMVRTHGMSSAYKTKILGFNLRMPEIEAALGICQIEKLPKLLEKRAMNAAILRDELSNQAGISLPPPDGQRKNNYYLFTIAVSRKRDQMLQHLEGKLIDARVFYPLPIHKNPLYVKNGFKNVDLPNTEWASSHVLSLPVHPKLSEDDMKFIAEEVRTAVRQLVL